MIVLIGFIALLSVAALGSVAVLIRQHNRVCKHRKELQAKWDSCSGHPNYNRGMSEIWREVYEKDKK